jgi:hypothetical protein
MRRRGRRAGGPGRFGQQAFADPFGEGHEVQNKTGYDRSISIHLERPEHARRPRRLETMKPGEDRRVLLRGTAQKMHHDHGAGRRLGVVRLDRACADAIQEMILGAELLAGHWRKAGEK